MQLLYVVRLLLLDLDSYERSGDVVGVRLSFSSELPCN